MKVKELIEELRTMPTDNIVLFEYEGRIINVSKITKGVNEYDGVVFLDDSTEDAEQKRLAIPPTTNGNTHLKVERTFEDGCKRVSFKAKAITKDGEKRDAVVVLPRCRFEGHMVELCQDAGEIFNIEVDIEE